MQLHAIILQQYLHKKSLQKDILNQIQTNFTNQGNDWWNHPRTYTSLSGLTTARQISNKPVFANHTNHQEGRQEQTVQLSATVSNIRLLQCLGTRYTHLHHAVLWPTQHPILHQHGYRKQQSCCLWSNN